MLHNSAMFIYLWSPCLEHLGLTHGHYAPDPITARWRHHVIQPEFNGSTSEHRGAQTRCENWAGKEGSQRSIFDNPNDGCCGLVCCGRPNKKRCQVAVFCAGGPELEAGRYSNCHFAPESVLFTMKQKDFSFSCLPFRLLRHASARFRTDSNP